MKRVLPFIIIAVTSMLSFWYAVSDSDPQPDWVTLEGEAVIHAGDAWELSLAMEDAGVGDTVNVTLLNGLEVIEEKLTLGTGGVAIWRIPENQIIQAGESLIIVQFGDKIVKQSLTVKAGKPVDGVLFTTTHNLPAYGEGSATILFLSEDKWGNMPTVSQAFKLDIRFPDKTPIKEILTYQNGLGRFYLQSSGDPGRVRLSVEQEPVYTNIELMQTAGEPQFITFSITPDCVLNDGRDLITFKAFVTDQTQNPVIDGTLVKFLWSGGLAYGRTIDGIATLRLPAPEQIGQAFYQAISANVRSRAISIQVTGDTCP